MEKKPLQDARKGTATPFSQGTSYPGGWGTSPRPAPTAASYKPAHGGYPGTPKLRNPQPFC